MHEARLTARIEELLTNLEACHSAGLLLAAEDVGLAAKLIRLYATQENECAAWIAREHARHVAKLFKRYGNDSPENGPFSILPPLNALGG